MPKRDHTLGMVFGAVKVCAEAKTGRESVIHVDNMEQKTGLEVMNVFFG